MAEGIYHVGRHVRGSKWEDACPCPKAPCGLAILYGDNTNDSCDQHSYKAAKTMRQIHESGKCPGKKK